MDPIFDGNKKIDTRVGFMNKLPEKLHRDFLKSLDLKTRNMLRLVSPVDHEIVDSVKVDIDLITFFDEGTILTAQKKKDEECFLHIRSNQYDASHIGYILNTFNIKEIRVLRSRYIDSLVEIDQYIHSNSIYVQDFWCEEYDKNAYFVLQRCIAGKLKTATLNMSHPPMLIDNLFHVPAVTCAEKLHIIHHKDSPILYFCFIRRWVQHANLEESVGRKIITEGHSLLHIEKFIDFVKNKCKRSIVNPVGISNCNVVFPKDSRFIILMAVKVLDEDKRRLTAVVIPKDTKVEDYEKFIRIPEDDVKEEEKEDDLEEMKDRKEQKKEQDENVAGGIAIEKEELIGFEKDCSFIDSAELPKDLL